MFQLTKIALTLSTLAIVSCTQQNFVTQEEVANLEQLKQAPLQIAISGELKGQTEPCSCSLLPLGGQKRRLILLDKIKKENPDTLFINEGNLFGDKASDPSTTSQAELKSLWLSEISWGLSAIQINAADEDFLIKQKLKNESNKDSLFWYSEAKSKNFSTSLGNIEISNQAPATESQNNEKPIMRIQLANKQSSYAQATLHFKYIEFNNDTLLCQEQGLTLECGGIERGRSVGILKIYPSKKQKVSGWLSLSQLKMLADEHAVIQSMKKGSEDHKFSLSDLEKRIPKEALENFHIYDVSTLPVNKDLEEKN